MIGDWAKEKHGDRYRKKVMTTKRCPWPGEDPLYVAYHDEEWGVPEWEDRALFEKLMLDGFQAGLSWITVLRKREAFRSAFDDFNPERIARYSEAKIARLLANPGIIRHRGKIEAVIGNAQAYLKVQETDRGFSALLWDIMDGTPRINRHRRLNDVPAETLESKAMSKILKAEGFRFCGPTIVYAFMQAVGMVNDHLTSCYRHEQCIALARKPSKRAGRTKRTPKP
jgi:DNA-3-methyladenine glycosylase I